MYNKIIPRWSEIRECTAECLMKMGSPMKFGTSVSGSDLAVTTCDLFAKKSIKLFLHLFIKPCSNDDLKPIYSYFDKFYL